MKITRVGVDLAKNIFQLMGLIVKVTWSGNEDYPEINGYRYYIKQ